MAGVSLVVEWLTALDTGEDKQQINYGLIQFPPAGLHTSPHGAVGGGGIGMKGLIFCVFAIMVLTPAQGRTTLDDVNVQK